MTRPTQLALDLASREALGAEDFLVAPSNQSAVDWIDRWPAWPGRGLILHGRPGCGKTHLAKVWAERSDSQFVDASKLERARVADFLEQRLAKGIILEHADRAPDQAALLHMLNAAREADVGLLLTGRGPPVGWSLTLPDLSSRIMALPAVGIGAPDDSLLAAVLIKQFRDRQIMIDETVVAFLLTRMERSFASARRIVATIDRTALAKQRRITVALAREALADLPSD